MARPENPGIPYFPVVTEWDQKLKLVRAKYKLVGVGCIVELWKAIYREGYALTWDEDAELLFADENSIDLEDLRAIVTFAVSKGIFDKGLLENRQVLTSHGIQKQWLAIAKAAHRKSTTIDDDLCLLSEKETETDKLASLPRDGSVNSRVYPATNELTRELTTQSKAKQSKVKQSKAAESGAPFENLPEGEDGLAAFAMRLALERKAKNPQAMAVKLMTEPDVIAAFEASKSGTPAQPGARDADIAPEPPACTCGGEIKALRVEGEGRCLKCGQGWTYDRDWLEWIPDPVPIENTA